MDGTEDCQSIDACGKTQQTSFKQSSEFLVTEKSPLVISTNKSNEDTSANFLVQSRKELRKSLGFKHAFASVITLLLGSGTFVSPSLVAKYTRNMGMALIVWLIAGLVCLFGALCFCELACIYKKTGNVFLYIYKAYGKLAGFMVIWIGAMVIYPSGLSVISLTIGEHIVGVIPNIDNYDRAWLVKIIGILSVTIATGINCISAVFVGRTQIFFSAVQSLSAIFLIVLGISQVATGHVENFTVMFNNTSDFSFGDFGLALYNALWAFDAWGETTSIAEELNNLERDLWLSFVTGIPFVIMCYLFVNLALISALTRKEIIDSDTVATTFVAKVLGRKVSYIIPVAVALSCFGTLVSIIFMTSRDLLSAAREGQLPIVFSYIHHERRTPIPSLLFICALSIIWMLPSGIEDLITCFSIAIWLNFGLALFSVVVMRIRRPDLPRPYKVWLANPILTSLFSLFLVVIPFVKHPVESMISLFIFLTGLPIYYIFIKKHQSLPNCFHQLSDTFVAFLKRRFNLVPCVFDEITYEKNNPHVSYENSTL